MSLTRTQAQTPVGKVTRPFSISGTTGSVTVSEGRR